MSVTKKYFFGLLGLLMLFHMPVHAYEKGDFILRAGIATVDPREDSDNLQPTIISPDGRVGLDNDSEIGLTATYMITNEIGIEVLAATPFTHTATFEGDLGGAGSVATVKHLPPTISAQYYFNYASVATPYVGAGINYTMMLETKATSNGEAVLNSLGISNHDVEADNSVGLALQAGVDVELTENLIFNAAVWWIDIDTEVEVAEAVEVDLEIDPWVYMIGLGYKF